MVVGLLAVPCVGGFRVVVLGDDDRIFLGGIGKVNGGAVLLGNVELGRRAKLRSLCL